MRNEHDSIGCIDIPDEAYYGVQSTRAQQNFPITGNRMLPEFINSLAEIKKAAAITNFNAGTLDEARKNAIVSACDEILAGKLHEQFIVDPIQGGAGTSANMNANEVIANRATELMGGVKGNYIVHPNDHVNMAQSTNDVYPSAGKLATLKLLKGLVASMKALNEAIRVKSSEFGDVIKLGRTQLQDAVPVRLGQEFAAYYHSIARSIDRIIASANEMRVLNMGATAIGTAINTTESYLHNIVPNLSEVCGEELRQCEDLIDGTQNPDGFAVVSASVKNAALVLSKIANDLRLLSCGPRGGLAEIHLPARQHGSSIMPGKINPVMPEVVSQVAFRVAGNDVTVSMAVEAGQLELNAFEPVLFHSLFESITLMSRVCDVFRAYCIEGITADRENCMQNLMNSTAVATALCPRFGYEATTKIVKHALQQNRRVVEVAAEELNMPINTIEQIFRECLEKC